MTYRMEAVPVNMVTVVISARILAVNAINVLLAHVAIQSVTKVRILFQFTNVKMLSTVIVFNIDRL